MFRQWLKPILAKPLRMLRGQVLWMLVMAAVACNVEATATPISAPVPTPAPIATVQPTVTPAPTPNPTNTPWPEMPHTGYITKILTLAHAPPRVENNRHWLSTGPDLLQHDVFMETLLGIDEHTGEVVPLLARKWSVGYEFKRWHFELEENVEFHFGRGEFSSSDVVHSHSLLVAEESRSPLKAVWEGATTLSYDDYNIEFNFDSPNPHGASLFSRHVGDLLISSQWQFQKEGVGAFDGEETAGTGAFNFALRNPGLDVYYHPPRDYPEYGGGYYDAFRILWAEEEDVRLAALLADQATVAQLGRELQIEAERRGMKVVRSTQVTERPTVLFRSSCFGNRPSEEQMLLEDARTRMALNSAVDREALNDAVYYGRAFAPQGRFPPSEMTPGNYFRLSPDLARTLLQASGYGPGNPLRIRLVAEPSHGIPELWSVAQAMRDMYVAVGVDASLARVDREEWQALVLGEAREDTVALAIGAPGNFIGPDGHLAGNEDWDGVPDLFVSNKLRCMQLGTDARRVGGGEVERTIVDSYFGVPMFELYHEVVVQPDFQWTYPGLSTAGLSHFHNIVLH